MRYITREELRDKLDNREAFILVEALPEKYWREAHLPGALQMDYTEVRDKAPSLLPDKDAGIVVYCASTQCQNSTKAAQTLESLGYTDVFEYVEGKQHWIGAGLRLESSHQKETAAA